MLPLIYVAATVPLFIGSLVFGFFHIFMPSTINPAVSSVLTTVSVFYVIGLLLISIFVRAIRGTYGDRVGQVIMAASVVLIYSTSATVRPWNLIFAAIWALLLVADIMFLKQFTRAAEFTKDDLYKLDNLSRRVPGVRW